MREIKFRAWNKDYKKLFYYEKQNEGMLEIWLKNPNVYDVMQFTGLKDKNGKEIYEGDIVRAVAEDEHSLQTKTSDVIYGDSGAWEVRTPSEGEYTYHHGLALNWGGWKYFEVIGNIYENPELLTK